MTGAAEKAGRLLGYRTSVDLEEGLGRMLEWARELGPQESRYLEGGVELNHETVPATWRDRLI